MVWDVWGFRLWEGFMVWVRIAVDMYGSSLQCGSLVQDIFMRKTPPIGHWLFPSGSGGAPCS